MVISLKTSRKKKLIPIRKLAMILKRNRALFEEEFQVKEADNEPSVAPKVRKTREPKGIIILLIESPQ
jgi:hypothetical protein